MGQKWHCAVTGPAGWRQGTGLGRPPQAALRIDIADARVSCSGTPLRGSAFVRPLCGERIGWSSDWDTSLPSGSEVKRTDRMEERRGRSTGEAGAAEHRGTRVPGAELRQGNSRAGGEDAGISSGIRCRIRTSESGERAGRGQEDGHARGQANLVGSSGIHGQSGVRGPPGGPGLPSDSDAGSSSSVWSGRVALRALVWARPVMGAATGSGCTTPAVLSDVASLALVLASTRHHPLRGFGRTPSKEKRRSLQVGAIVLGNTRRVWGLAAADPMAAWSQPRGSLPRGATGDLSGLGSALVRWALLRYRHR